MHGNWFRKAVAALVSVGVLSLSGAASAADTVDQEHVTVAGEPVLESICDDFFGQLGQTFTAGITSTLTKVSVWVGRKQNFNQAVSVAAEIHAVNDGVPTSTILGSGSVVIPGGQEGWIDISVSPVSITKGTMYALFLPMNDCRSENFYVVFWLADYRGDWNQQNDYPAYSGGSGWYRKDDKYFPWRDDDFLFRTYVTPLFSTNANLYRVVLSTGTEDISLWGVNGPMSTSVSNNVESVTVTPELANGSSHATVNGTPVDYKGHITIPLAVGNNVIAIAVTAESGNTRVHYVTVRRAVGSNADLNGIVVQGHSLLDSFDAKTTDYTLKVDSDVKELTLGGVSAHRSATVTINGTTANIGAAVTTIALADGKNIVKFDVTAQDGVTHKTYTLVIVRGDAK